MKAATIKTLVANALETVAEACGTTACACVTLAAKLNPDGFDVRETGARKIGFVTTPELATLYTKVDTK